MTLKFLRNLPSYIFALQQVDPKTSTVIKEFDPVERRYSDFVWLRKKLVKAYRGYVIPPIPEKGIVSMYLSELIRMKVVLTMNFRAL